ncbi:hypothetical protein H4R20_002841 [Coemansia guatemalensis]|uniref:Uncharacterized protein n=1 Tax=Coemansia guatemalensis TaxID=2761395 RepID=A0A9W8HUS6_9FUNG|nr:hypothetical protein H4R20_002841 [Coemansia guatemalensis]
MLRLSGRYKLALALVLLLVSSMFLLIDMTLHGSLSPYVTTQLPMYPANTTVSLSSLDWKFPQSLAVIMPTNNKTDMQFYENNWVADHLFTVCDFEGPSCSMACNEESTWGSLHRKTRCFVNVIKEAFTDIEFFLKLDDDVFADKDYVLGLIKKYRGHKRPLLISHVLKSGDRINSMFDGARYGNGKFYMFNRRLLDCIDTNLTFHGRRNEDHMFGAMMRSGCGDKPNVTFVRENDAHIWHKSYAVKNKYINLAALVNHDRQVA